ncbi:Alpha/Beta hydrolase protein [Lophiotrema nucula]|uniref:Alpha/Beta hydrolase protein n=1 Tax=Lophiotrema nucula TaxID=690887 RepID=A0A6A5ZRN5_9PLEO|nr:Alpha/Beta hydrolase protein [Lophiotrema nucula]
MTACYESPVNGSHGSYFNTLTPTYYPPNGDCSDFYVPIHLDYEQPDLNITKWTNPYELQDFLSSLTARAGAMNPQQAPFGATKRFTGDYEIAASFCTPKKPKDGKEKVVIMATHGIGPARSHWNSPYKPDEFNFVKFALEKGYSVFFYDRLGCGASSRISGFEATLSTASAVIKTLATSLKQGKYTAHIKPSKLVLLGFSFASFTIHSTIAESPSIADAVILTGIGLNATAGLGLNPNGLIRSFVPRIANVENPALYGDRDEGYVTWPSVFDLIMNYFKAPFFAPETATFTESAKEPYAIGELLTFPGPASISAEKWDKPALHLTGEKDYIACDGDCAKDGIYETPSREYYKNARPLQLSVHPGASHHVNFHANATGAFEVITAFLDANVH